MANDELFDKLEILQKLIESTDETLRSAKEEVEEIKALVVGRSVKRLKLVMSKHVVDFCHYYVGDEVFVYIHNKWRLAKVEKTYTFRERIEVCIDENDDRSPRRQL